MNANDKPRTFSFGSSMESPAYCKGFCTEQVDYSEYHRRWGRGSRFLTSEERAKLENLLFLYNRDLVELKGGCELCIKMAKRHIHTILGALERDFRRKQLAFDWC